MKLEIILIKIGDIYAPIFIGIQDARLLSKILKIVLKWTNENINAVSFEFCIKDCARKSKLSSFVVK